MTFVPDYPSIVKSRPLTDDNVNSIVMKLDKVRHFIFVEDKKAFTEKKNMVIFRGKVRKTFQKAFYGNVFSSSDVRFGRCQQKYD